MHFYTDSLVILGNIANETRLFYVYISNRVAKIGHWHSSNPEQWHYVQTEQNPADLASRGVELNLDPPPMETSLEFVNRDDHKKVRPEVITPETVTKQQAKAIS